MASHTPSSAHPSVEGWIRWLMHTSTYTQTQYSCLRCGHIRTPRPSSSDPSSSSGPYGVGRKRPLPLPPGSGGGADEAEEAMLAAALAASLGEQVWFGSGLGLGAGLFIRPRLCGLSSPTFQQQPDHGGGGGNDDVVLMQALAASAASWRCGACTFENVGDGVKVGGGDGMEAEWVCPNWWEWVV